MKYFNYVQQNRVTQKLIITIIFLQNIYFVKSSKCFHSHQEHPLCFAWLHLQPSVFTQKLILSIDWFILGVELLYIKGKGGHSSKIFPNSLQITLYAGSLADSDEGIKCLSFDM